MSGYDVIQLIDQFRSLKSDMCRSFLKVFDRKHLVLVTVGMPVLMNMIAETTAGISAVVGNRFAFKQHSHAFHIDQLIPLRALAARFRTSTIVYFYTEIK